ncbi:hypothetical protein [Motiliproteus sp. SC1-56]|uniref:hypothetical protein n=1 Tax=Motiliproteus sp. SC1-56 TaxID=2799565 RepID=UPI001A8FC83F|nr:hypothetical protein [Motiliproteus sp. SC1-56]
MKDELKPLGDIWIELQLVTMDAELSEADRERLESLLESLKGHINYSHEPERKMILKWFTTRLGNRLFSNHYKQLLLELANLMATFWTGAPRFHTSDEVLAWINDEHASLASKEPVNKVTSIR